MKFSKYNYSDVKQHYRMYKSGKKWIFAAIATVFLSTGALFIDSSSNVSADVLSKTSATTSDDANKAQSDKTLIAASDDANKEQSDKTPVSTSDDVKNNSHEYVKINVNNNSNLLKMLQTSLVQSYSDGQSVYIDRNNFDKYFTFSSGNTDLNGRKYDPSTGVQELTNGAQQVGTLGFNGSIDLSHDFSINGAINLGQEDTQSKFNGVADGIGFVFYKGERGQSGGIGGDLGINGLPNVFGWKADTWANHDHEDEYAPQILNGDYDNGLTVPYGAFVTTDSTGYGKIDRNLIQNFNKDSIEDNQFHNVAFNYTASDRKLVITINDGTKDYSFSKNLSPDMSGDGYHFTIASSTGMLRTHQSFRIDSMSYTSAQKANINYIDDTDNGKIIKTDVVNGHGGDLINYSTDDSIKQYEKSNYKIISNDYSQGVRYDDNDTADQVFNIHMEHTYDIATPDKPGQPGNGNQPGQPIDPNNPDGPKWPAGTDKDSLSKTSTRTIEYVDGQTNQPIAGVNKVTQSVTYNRTAVVDKVTGQIVGYDTTGDGKVDTTDGNTAWQAANGKDSWDKVTSPDLSNKGYGAPSQTQVDSQKVNPGDSSNTIKVYYQQIPIEPIPGDNNKPGKPGDNNKPGKPGDNNKPGNNKEEQKLPQTGENDKNNLSLLGIIMIGISLMFGKLFGKRNNK
ncbi:lectin-like domain-containing protein [Apilactobacillus xinyiensis]|uniref:lectin-like domain-containing protein n=1 Tax=Apilactobacillus xinyiensis TaxID=2841032 RepID=UPI003364BB8C